MYFKEPEEFSWYRAWGSIPVGARKFLYAITDSGAYTASYPVGTRGAISTAKNGRGVTLTYLHLVLR
jgi:hypothetical protein